MLPECNQTFHTRGKKAVVPELLVVGVQEMKDQVWKHHSLQKNVWFERHVHHQWLWQRRSIFHNVHQISVHIVAMLSLRAKIGQWVQRRLHSGHTQSFHVLFGQGSYTLDLLRWIFAPSPCFNQMLSQMAFGIHSLGCLVMLPIFTPYSSQPLRQTTFSPFRVWSIHGEEGVP